MTKHKFVKFEYDRESDAAYLKICPSKVVESEEVEPRLIVDFGRDDQIVGVEFLRFARRFARQTKKLTG